MSTFTPSAEQAAIIDAPVDADVLVVAGAGSGKTFTMTQRIIALINRGVAPERILGLTFTRKAAGELLERVSAAVAGDMAGSTTATVSDRAFLKPAIFTYDAFFQTIVRQYGLLVGFDQNTQPLSAAGALQLATEVIDSHMDLAFSEDFGAFSSLANRVLALSDAIGSAMIGAGCTSFDDAINRVRQWDSAFINRLQQAVADEPMPEDEPKIPKIKRLKKDTDASWQAKLDDRAEHLHARCTYHCGALLETTRKRDILLQLVEAYAQAKRERNMAEFSDFTIAAYQLIERFPSIGERTRRRYSHVLLDEYQDTSTTQAALLAALFHVDASQRSAVNAVGDPFQSIYAWRGASPGAFRMFQQDFHLSAGYKPFPLSVTRRNSRIVLEAANNLTLPLRSNPSRPSSSLMREVDVSSLDPMPDAPEGTLGVLGFATAGQEIDAVVRFCKTAIARHRSAAEQQEQMPGEQKAPVAVLFRSKSHMPEYQAALEQAGLTTFVVGYSALLERPEIRDLMALLHVAADHTDTGSLMRLLATPRFTMSAADLTMLARFAEEQNTEQRFQALVQAGLAQPDTPANEWAAVVREYRDQVANAVFLPDVLLRGDLVKLLERLSAHGRNAITRAAVMLRQVHDAVGRPLGDVIRAGIEALDLDIDTVLAGVLHNPQHRANPALAHMPMDAIVDLVDTYTQEIAAEQTPSLHGFITWVDHLASVEDEAASLPDAPVDVELMTVHQSKGLEWDAVAVVGLTAVGFPSNQGDHLKIVLDEHHTGGTEQGHWTAPEYHETADSWLTNPTAVPVPMRADAGILPRFPHDALVGGNPLEALEMLEDAEIIDDEVFGTLRNMSVDDMEGIDPDGLYLTQIEEYGRRLHADERRLAYVALTRARHEALLTCSATNAESRDPRAVGDRKRVSKPSNFLVEVRDSMLNIVSRAAEPSNLADIAEVDDVDSSENGMTSLHSIDAPLPDGFFVGEHARDFEDAVVGDAWNAPLEPSEGNQFLPWPCELSDETLQTLRLSALQVDSAMNNAVGQTDGRAGERAGGQVGEPVGGEGAGRCENTGASLLRCAQLLVADSNLMPDMLGEASQDAFDSAVRAKGERILASGRQNVTSLQARAGMMDERGARTYWRGLVRPIPNVASPAAQLGTQFHAWAERFIMADANDAGIGVGASGNGGTRVAESRLAMLAELRRNNAAQSQDNQDDNGADNNGIFDWQQRLATSTWARRKPAWAERQIVVNVPQLGTIVNGKLDAVFFGGLDGADRSKQYTIVDWKTGKKPRKKEEIQKKLAQLDMYRILLSAMEGVPLTAIDACLYYLSEPIEGDRQLNAADKTEEEILAELSYGIPEQSDND